MHKFIRQYGILLMCLCLGISSTALAGPADWSGQGPFAGSVYTLTADPLLGSRIYAYTSNGFFRSDDGGTSWQLAESGLAEGHPATGVFIADTVTSGGLWLFDDYGRLYRSTDTGTSWLATGYTAPTVPYLGGNGFAQSGATTLWFSAGSGGLLKSTDGGATFAAVGGVFAGQTVQFVATNPTNPLQVVVGLSTASSCTAGNCAIYYSSDGGASWSPATFDATTLPAVAGPPPIQRTLKSVAFGPSGSHRIYAIYSDVVNYGYVFLIRSDNDGASWTGYDQSTPGARLPPLGIGFAGVALAASPTTANTVYLDSAVSTNGGTSFTALPTNGRTTNGLLLPGISAVALHPAYPSRVLVGTNFAGIYLSSNSGTNWAPSNDGLAASDIRTILVHPQDHTRLFAGYGDALTDPSPAFYRSTTAGTWNISNSGLNAYQLRTLAFDQTTTSVIGSTVIFAVGNGFDGAASTVNRNTGIYKSIDGGLTWNTIGNGLPLSSKNPPGGHYAGALRTIVIDPRSCASPPPSGPCTTGPLLTLYATGAGSVHNSDGSVSNPAVHQWRVMKSIDGGVNWASSETGLPADVVNPDGSGNEIDGVTPIVIDPSNGNTLYIGTFASGYDALGNPVSPTVPTGVFKSTDAGAHWVQASTGLPTYPGSPQSVYNTLSLAIDPAHPQTLWVSTINFNFNAPGQIFKSTDGAAHWTVSNAGVSGPDVRALLVDSTDSTVLYAASGGLGPANPGGVYKSIDAGATWSSISLGLPSNNATALTLDPIDPTVLYAGTSGGVYSITQLPDADADGVPDLIENAGPNGGDANNDGLPDSEQPTVSTTAPGLLGTSGWQPGIQGIADGTRAKQASLKLQQMHQSQAADTSSGTQGGYFSVQIISGDCTHSVDVSAVAAGPLGLDTDATHGTYTYPRELLRFELPTCSNAVVEITFNGATFGPGWSWRYYGPSTPGDNSTLGWHNATSLVQSQSGSKWRINLAAGQFGSYRPAGAQSILFEGGPAYSEEIFKNSFE